MFKTSLILSLLFAMNILTSHASLATPPAIGKAAPEFSLKNLDGKQVKLSDFAGKIVVLEWINEGCPFVKGHYENGHMQSLQKKYTGAGVVWLTINSTRPDHPEAKTPSQEKGILIEWKSSATDHLVDADRTVGHLYEAKTTPHMFVIDKAGILRYSGAIDDDRSTGGGVAATVNYVSKSLDSIMDGKEVATTSTKAYGCSVKY